MNSPSYRWAFVAPSDALKYVADPALVTYTDATYALKHGSGSFVIVTDGNRVVAAVNADDMLREFTCNVALGRLHEWDAPDVVKEYLTTRNPDLREAAQDAIRDATCDVAQAAARYSDWGGAWAAARAVALLAARDTAALAARDAAVLAARDDDQLDILLLNRLGLPT